MRIYFDTNVLFPAFVSHGVCAGLYEECLQRATLVVSDHILAELEEKLITKAKVSKNDAREVVSAVLADPELIKAKPLNHSVCRDPDDDLVLGGAHEAKADAIVTGDQDLLVLKQYQGIPILNPRDCLAFLAEG